MSELRGFIIEFLRILADPTRLEILDLLKEREMTSADVQTALKRSQSTISKHLNMLVETNLLEVKKKKVQKNQEEGTKNIKIIKYYSVKTNDIFTLLTNIETFVNRNEKQKIKVLRDLDLDEQDVLS